MVSVYNWLSLKQAFNVTSLTYYLRLWHHHCRNHQLTIAIINVGVFGVFAFTLKQAYNATSFPNYSVNYHYHHH